MTSTAPFSRNLLALSLGLALAGTAQAQSAPRFSTLAQATPGQSTVYDGLIVTYRDGSSARRDANAAASTLNQAARSSAGTWASTYRQSVPALSRVRRLATGADLVRPNRALSPSQLETLMTSLRADPAVAHVEPNLILKPVRSTAQATASAVAAPNDPGYEVQWHLRTPDGHLETLAPETTGYANRGGIDLLPAWQYGTGQGVVVAVIDTGITAHPDLDTSLANAGYDFISDALMSGRASNGRAAGGWDTGDWTTDDKYLVANGGCAQPNEQSDSSWHGTHVAGTIAMRTNNGIGMAGIAPDAKILPIRALGHCGGTTADIADAIVWASGGHVDGVPDNTNPAEVINMSLGGGGSCAQDSVTANAISSAIARGSVVVVAAGNDNADAAAYSPASCPGVINIAATGITGGRAYYSNYGNTITLSAPGGGVYANDASSGSGSVRTGLVWSTLNKGTHGPDQPTYAGYAGTSMASPHVAGVVALAISAAISAGRPVPTSAQMRDILTQTSNVFPVKPTLRIGAGILNAGKAVARAAGASGGGEEATATPIARGTQSKLSAAAGQGTLYRLDVPTNARNLQIRTLGGSGQLRLYVRAVRAPSADGSDADYSSVRNGTTQNVQMAVPATGSYFFRLVGGSGGYANVTLSVSYSE
ncbi:MULTISPECIES: S8 family serine peptidase [Xanthomonas]|uniref:S8 family serine peptidase n=1 Tax=Xanthomonas rydalmerensis TaxID=3046274 RepID=A0ABZ0JM65_9XANT|nr:MULTISPECIES: S8 family serine peptidase [unclassified Xanthomonas]MXV07930.1 protease [Xanthomonas sp. LMG 9002]WOS40730.1 S8 family serine peptidase [Xanthomonas sp. DM-2023]WOS44914.1 S8 family serine peptidase [Xanthomonas sp. DM-2023]WOS49094.1 S8 family serine peptidase [Xanthomonas sp. DM-2023]WOS53274.1 S8 family serine peptidase [Xanthomonas sp. DM-2023]